jgi:hypothetical protein
LGDPHRQAHNPSGNLHRRASQGRYRHLADRRQEVAKVGLKRTVSFAFSASETFDVGADLGSTVSNDYYDRRLFAFTGKIGRVKVQLIK